jgi:hypothetical protein
MVEFQSNIDHEKSEKRRKQKQRKKHTMITVQMLENLYKGKKIKNPDLSRSPNNS